MSPPPPDKTIYLNGSSEPVFAVFHPAAATAARDTAVIVCPPFGWDEVCSYRPRRDWAQRLAGAGYATLRLSYPGSGDSGGAPGDPKRLEVWTDAVGQAAAWMRSATGAQRTVAIGIELGGLIAYRAVAAGAAIDDMVLWASPGRGRALIRQLRAFSALELSQFFQGLEPPPPLATGELQAGGFLLSAETVQTLSQLDLTELALPNARSRRVLLLDRDGIGVDAPLRERLASLGAAVTVAPGPGYVAMTSHPQTSVAPVETIERVTAWLDEASPPRAGTEPAGGVLRVHQATEPAASDSATLKVGEVSIRETPLSLEQPFGRVTGIVTEPSWLRERDLCAVFLNAGAVRRTGPSRMWVETARRWATRGVRCVRFDIEGIGEADGETTPYARSGSLYAPKLVTQVAAALDALHDRGLGERFVLVGLCAGAYWSLQLELEDPRIVAALMVNPSQLVWDPNLAPARDFRALFTEPLSWAKIRRNATAERVSALTRWLLGAPKRKLMPRRRASGENDPIDQLLERLRMSGRRALFLFSEHEALRRELERSGALARLEQWENVTVEYIPVRDHTLRPYHSQRQAAAVLDRALDLELGVSSDAKLVSIA